MLINNPPRLQEHKEWLKNRPHRCLKYRKPAQIFVEVLFWATTLALLIVTAQKHAQICDANNLYVLCLANYNCAYIRKTSN